MAPLYTFWVGLCRRRGNLLNWFLGFFGAVWLVIESTSYFSSGMKQFAEGNVWFLLAVIFGASVGVLLRAWEPHSVTVTLPTTSTAITVRFDDFFSDRNAHLAVAVNDGFDGELGQTIAPHSLHGQFIQKFHSSNHRTFEAACDGMLEKSLGQPSGRRNRKLSYPIGTTIALPLEGRKAFLFALAATDAQSLKARADIPMMWNALGQLWKCVRVHSNGRVVRLPLVGGGQSGVGIEPHHLLRLIMLSILVATREAEISKRIEIVVHPDLFDKIDLRSVKDEWS